MILLISLGYLLNFLMVVLSSMNHPAPSTIRYELWEKVMLAIPFGPVIFALVAFIFSPWID